MNFKKWLLKEDTNGQAKLMAKLKQINDDSDYAEGFGKDGENHFLLTLYSAAMDYPKGTKIASLPEFVNYYHYLKDPDIKNLFDKLVKEGRLKAIEKNNVFFLGKPSAVDQLVKDIDYIQENPINSENPKMSEELKRTHRRVGALLGYKPERTEDWFVHIDNLFHNVPETILIGSARVYLLGNTLKIYGRKNAFDVKIKPDQANMLKNMGTLSTLQKENVIGNMPPSKYDFSKSSRPAGLEFIDLGVARIQLGKDSIHLNKTKIQLTTQQVKDIKDLLEIQ